MSIVIIKFNINVKRPNKNDKNDFQTFVIHLYRFYIIYNDENTK